MRPFAVTLAVLASVAALADASSPKVDVAAPPRVEALEVDGIKGLRAVFHVAAPADLVFATLWDVKRFKEIFPDIHSLEVVRDAGDELDVRFFVDAVLADVSYTLRRKRDAKLRTIAWHNIAGDIELIRGSWTVKTTPDPNISEVVYTSFVDVMAVVPSSLVRDTAMKKTDEMATRVRAVSKKRWREAMATPPAPAASAVRPN